MSRLNESSERKWLIGMSAIPELLFFKDIFQGRSSNKRKTKEDKRKDYDNKEGHNNP